MSQRGVRRVLAPAFVLLALGGGLVGCGSESADDPQAGSESSSESPSPSGSSSSGSPSGSPSDSPSESVPPDAPKCAATWREGKPIPRFYAGCVDDSGTYVEREGYACSSGQRMVIFRDRYYGVLGGTVHAATKPLDKDPDYRRDARECRA